MIDTMIYELTTSKYNRIKDQIEISGLMEKYGDDYRSVVVERATDKKLDVRDRRHWRRITRAIKYFGPNASHLDLSQNS